jgi:hypothetical protein
VTDIGNVGGNVLRIPAYTDPGDKFLETGAIIIDFYLTAWYSSVYCGVFDLSWYKLNKVKYRTRSILNCIFIQYNAKLNMS